MMTTNVQTSELIIYGARLAWPTVYEPRKSRLNPEADPYYSCVALFDDDTEAALVLPAAGGFTLGPREPAVLLLSQIAVHVATGKWGERANGLLSAFKDDEKLCFSRKPKRNSQTGEIYEGFEGKIWLSANARASEPPLLRDKNGRQAAPGLIYGGCYGNVHVRLWPRNNPTNRGISADLRGVQFVRDGDAFGGSSAANDVFGSVTAEEGTGATAQAEAGASLL